MRIGCLRRSSLRPCLAVAFALAFAALAPAWSDNGPSKARISARISVRGHPFRIAAGRKYVWVLDRGSTGCRRQRCTVFRIDPETNRVVGKRTPLPADAWDLTVGAGSVWVTQFDGRLVRVNARTGRITARIDARPLYFGSAIAFGDGFVFTGNDDERNRRGATVAKIDPAGNRVVGKVAVARPSSPQSIGFGLGAVWVADHAGWLVKVDPKTFKVVARQRLRFGPHGVVATDGAVYVADAHANRLLEADPATARIRQVATIPPGPISPVAGAGSIWSSSASAWGGADGMRDDRVLRIDPTSLEIVQVLHVGGSVPSVGFGFGSVWVPDQTGHVVRVTP
jgi:DNA-binding beta-propeller fold protein YncE